MMLDDFTVIMVIVCAVIVAVSIGLFIKLYFSHKITYKVRIVKKFNGERNWIASRSLDFEKKSFTYRGVAYILDTDLVSYRRVNRVVYTYDLENGQVIEKDEQSKTSSAVIDFVLYHHGTRDVISRTAKSNPMALGLILTLIFVIMSALFGFMLGQFVRL